MIGKLKLAGVVLGTLATACLASHRAKVRRELGHPSMPMRRRGPSRSDLREPGTTMDVDAGGQTA